MKRQATADTKWKTGRSAESPPTSGIAKQRIELAMQGRLPRRPLGKLVYVPNPNDKITKRPKELDQPIKLHNPQSDLMFA